MFMQLVLRFMIALAFLLLAVDNAEAHRFAPSLLKFVEITQHEYKLVWKTPTEATSNIPMRPTWPVSCEITSQRPAVREGTGTISSWTLRCDALGTDGLIGQKIGVTGLAANQTSAMVVLSLLDGRDYQSVVNAEQPDFLVPKAPGHGAVMTQYPVLGFEHIWQGLDHLMFVFGLLLLVGGGSRLIWTITAFTVGHSITLAIVTLGFLDYSVSLIEFAIALSIFALAIELSRKAPINEDLVRRQPWWLAGGFGLLHGMGFAGALAEIGLPQDNVPLALLSFNVGIEIGQLAFVFLALGAWWVIKRILSATQVTVSQAQLITIPVYLLGGLSAMWCIERSLEMFG
ncbi:MAG: hypothetical protein ACI82A_001309 [Candidatus Azotimanducaceae bacterium]|jgi:hypothetical protein